MMRFSYNKCRIQVPNFYTLIWLVICLRVLLFSFGFAAYLEYVIWLLALLFFLASAKKINFSSLKKIIVPFIIISCFQTIGTIQNPTGYAIRNIVSTFCVLVLLITMIGVKSNIQVGYIKLLFFAVAIVSFLVAQNSESVQNTLPACILYMSLFVLIFTIFDYLKKGKFDKREGKIVRLFRLFEIALYFVIPFIISYKYSSRTTLFMIPIFVACFLFFSLVRKTQNTFRFFFFLLLIAVFVLIYIFIYIDEFSWYYDLNKLSNEYFGKNLNSQRGLLWKTGLDSMETWQFILGKGTGVLPTNKDYFNNSFHSSYMQLFIQSGAISLICFVYVLKYFWDVFSTKPKSVLSRLLISALVCVIVYNCFECTLLQNKTFLGVIQWFILCAGVKQLDSVSYICSEKQLLKNPCFLNGSRSVYGH